MGKDHRIKGHRLLARCCYGSCLGFGFVITTVTFAAMFWIIWCYFGLSFVHFSDSQRRALVNYPPVTAKPLTPFSPTSSPHNPEVSLNQIPNSSTATSYVRRNDSPSNTEKKRDLSHERSSVSAENANRNNKTSGRDTTSTEDLKRNSNKRDNSAKHDSFEIRSDSTSLHNEQYLKRSNKDGSSDIPKNSRMPEMSTKRDDIPVKRSELGKNDNFTARSYPDEGITEATNTGKDSSYIDPVFIRENSRIPSRDEPQSGYDSRPRSEPNTAKSQDVSSSNDNRRVPADSVHASRDDVRAPSESIPRERIPVESRHLDSDIDQRRSEDKYRDSRRDRVDKFDDMPVREIRNRDRVSEEQYNNGRKRANRQDDSIAKEDVYRGKEEDERYSEGRRRVGSDRYDERYRDRVTIDDKYDDRYRDRVPVDDKYDDRYRDRVPVDDKYDDRHRDRVPVDDKYDDRYRDRVPVDDKYDDRYRDRVPIEDKYDERRRTEDRYRDRVPVDDKYIERYPDERRRRGDSLDYDDKPVREYRYRDRAVQDDRYLDGGRRRTSDDRYEYRPQVDERYRDDVRKTTEENDGRKDDGSKYESRSVRDRNLRPRDEPDYRDDAKIKSSDDILLDRSYDTRGDTYRSRDSFKEERVGSDRNRNRDDNLERSRPRDGIVDRYDNEDARRNRERIPSTRDVPEYVYPSRTDDKRYIPPPSERDLLSSRAEYEPLPVRISPERREYSTRNERKDYVDDVSDRGQSGSYSEDYNTEKKRYGASESRYENGYRNQEYQDRSQYDDRDRISPTRVRDGDFRSKSLNEDSMQGTSLRDDRSSTSVRNTNNENNGDRIRMSTRLDGSLDQRVTSINDRNKERAKDLEVTRSEYDSKSSDAKRTSLLSTEEGVIDRRSYSSEDGFNGNKKPQNPVYSRDRNYRPINKESHDYPYDDSGSKYNDRVDDYRPSRQTGYDADDYSNRGSNSRNRQTRYDEARDSRVRNRDSNNDRYSEDSDAYRGSRLGDEETPRRNRERSYEEKYDEKYETRSYDRYPSSGDEIRKGDTVRTIRRDSGRSDSSESRNRRYRPEDDRGTSISRDISGNLKDERYSEDRSSMESRRDRNPLPLNRGSESQRRTLVSSNKNGQLIPRAESTDSASPSSSSLYDPAQPLSAKDVIDAALRHSETPGETEKKVFYPVFDPRSTNLTSSDIIRPSERKGITVTAKKKRKR